MVQGATSPDQAGGREDLASSLADMARDLLEQSGVQQTLDAIVRHAVRLVDGCEHAGILAVRKGKAETLAATGPVVSESDRLQVESGEGPCFDATRERARVFRIEDLTISDRRWPRYAPQARELGMGSMMGFLLYTTGTDNLGALNLYSSRPSAFSESSERVGWLLASHAAVALSSARHDENMQRALDSARMIGEATGVIMSRDGLTDDEAFHKIVLYSQHHNIKIRALAEEIVRTGELPGP